MRCPWLRIQSLSSLETGDKLNDHPDQDGKKAVRGPLWKCSREGDFPLFLTDYPYFLSSPHLLRKAPFSLLPLLPRSLVEPLGLAFGECGECSVTQATGAARKGEGQAKPCQGLRLRSTPNFSCSTQFSLPCQPSPWSKGVGLALDPVDPTAKSNVLSSFALPAPLILNWYLFTHSKPICKSVHLSKRAGSQGRQARGEG